MGLLQKVASAASNAISVGLLHTPSAIKPAAALSGAPLDNTDEFPIPGYQFSIEFGTVIVALFQSVRGLSVSREVEPLKVGGENNFGREFPGHISYGHATFEVGLTSSLFFYDWMMAGQLDGYAAARDFTLIQRRPNPDGGSPIFKDVHRWNFKNAFPVSWKISDLSIDDSQKIVIESLELSFDYFERG